MRSQKCWDSSPHLFSPNRLWKWWWSTPFALPLVFSIFFEDNIVSMVPTKKTSLWNVTEISLSQLSSILNKLKITLTLLHFFGYGTTARLLTHVLCKPTHFFFRSFIATMSYPLQTSFNNVTKDWADTFHVCGTPTRSSSRSARDNSNRGISFSNVVMTRAQCGTLYTVYNGIF